jgi:hypothetical protein
MTASYSGGVSGLKNRHPLSAFAGSILLLIIDILLNN